MTTGQGSEGWGETFGFRAVTSAKLAIDELTRFIPNHDDRSGLPGPAILEEAHLLLDEQLQRLPHRLATLYRSDH
jgi:hypothetical protein